MFCRPGAGFSGKPDAAAVASYAKQAQAHEIGRFRPAHHSRQRGRRASRAATSCRCCCSPVLFGFALMALGERGNGCATMIDDFAHAMFGVIAIVMKAAPIGAFGAMAYTIGKYGPTALGNLIGLIATFYSLRGCSWSSCSAHRRIAGFSIFKFIAYIKDELLIVLGTVRPKARCRN
jgi:aerobic C4-dicarboxylate transport protein